MEFGDKIVNLRKFAGLLQKELAAKIGCSESRISEYENDVYVPTHDVLLRISDACKMHIGYFYDNLLPHDYYQVGKHLKYAYYLSVLPSQVRRYQKKMLFRAYKLSIKDFIEIDKVLLKKPNAEGKKKRLKASHKEYFSFLKKKASLNKVETSSITPSTVPSNLATQA